MARSYELLSQEGWKSASIEDLVNRELAPYAAERVSLEGPVLRLTQQDLASMIGARRENVNRALAYYQSRGWLSKEGGHFTILNEPQLRARAAV